MAEIKFDRLDTLTVRKSAKIPVYLIFGEEFFRKKAFEAIVSSIIPKKRIEYDLEEIEGLETNIHEAIERVNTYSLDSSEKVVAFIDTKIFYSKENRDDLVREIENAVAEGKPQKGISSFLKLAALLDLSTEELETQGPEAVRRALGLKQNERSDWIEAVLPAALEKVKDKRSEAGGADALVQAIENGFAPGNRLIITADIVDKRRRLYKSISEKGLVVDCSVAGGFSAADRKAQSAALLSIMEEFSKKSGKTIGADVFGLICEMTGFDPRTFQNSLEKLGAYTGNRKKITAKDVNQVLKKTRSDPIYELTGAVADRNASRALSLLDGLLSGHDEMHPLAVLAALLNMFRTLTVITDFMESKHCNSWRPGISYREFEARVAKELKEYDDQTYNIAKELENEIFAIPQKGKKSGNKAGTDLLISSGKKTLYPVYKNFEKAALFSMDELLSTLCTLQEADRRIKSGADPRLTLEHLIITVCRPKEPRRSKAAP